MSKAREISIHDNHLVSYEVLCERREIRLHTEFRDGPGPVEFTEVIFTGVACYAFQHDSDMGTIIFDVEEVPATEIYTEHAGQFQAGVHYGWPGEWGASGELAAAHFQQNRIQGYLLASSCGMSGWVLACDVKKVARATSLRLPNP